MPVQVCVCVHMLDASLLEALTATRRDVFGADRCGHLLLSLRQAQLRTRFLCLSIGQTMQSYENYKKRGDRAVELFFLLFI